MSQQQAVLTEKELECLRLTSMGRTAQQIAKELGNSMQVIKNRRNDVYKKLGVNNAVAASRWYWETYEKNKEGEAK